MGEIYQNNAHKQSADARRAVVEDVTVTDIPRQLILDPIPSRPRERIFEEGPEALSDRELIAVILGTGTAAHGVFSLAATVLGELEKENFRVSPKGLLSIDGMGPAKAAQMAATLEIGRRILVPRNYRIRMPADVVPLLQHYADRQQEHFLAVSLNGAHEVIKVRLVSIGLVNRTLVHPREVFAEALTERATGMICAHNHPSGNVKPSSDDYAVTRSLVEAGRILGIRLLDHIVFSARDYYSFLDHDEL